MASDSFTNEITPVASSVCMVAALSNTLFPKGMPMPDLSNAVAQFTYSEEQKNREESLRRQFVERFPASGMSGLTLEQYALGLEPKENSFCYWLEYKTYELGSIAGGSAFKFVIFFDKNDKKFKFADKYKSQGDAFATVKSGILELLRLGNEGGFVECENVPPFNTMDVIRGKILNMYFPEQFMPVFSLDHLKDFCLQLGIPADHESQTSMNLALLRFKQENPLFSGWANDKFASFLYDKIPPTVQFWKIAPGENARLWQDCLRDDIICVGWPELGDMRQEGDENEFKEKYRQVYGAQRIRQWKEIWSFAKNIHKGDIIVSNNGMKSIVGVGTVAGEYFCDNNRHEYKHCLPVKWNVISEFPVPESARDVVRNWFSGTVKRISRQEFNQLTSEQPTGTTHTPITKAPSVGSSPSTGRYAAICELTFLDEKFFADCERLLKTKKQIILQGAPGIGKTFVAEQLANLWAGDASRVKVVQFHESYGYEDFVHGIRPQRDPVTQKAAFVPTPGVFLNFCAEIEKDKSVPPPNYVLVIDEINRAKTARVFGELLYLLEYREKTVELQCGESFSIPQNLYITGTMNTTDKSIALGRYARLAQGWRRGAVVMQKNGRIKHPYMMVSGAEVSASRGQYQIVRYDGKTPIYISIGNDPTDALARFRAEKGKQNARSAAIIAGLEIAEPEQQERPKTLRQYADAFIRMHQSLPHRSDDSVRVYRRVTSTFLEQCSVAYPERITQADVIGWYGFLKNEGYNDRSRANLYLSLRGFLRYCGLDPRKIIDRGTHTLLQKYTKRTPNMYDAETVAKLIKAANDADEALLWDFAYKTGLRDSELQHVTRHDLHGLRTERPVLHVRERDEYGRIKDSEERVVELHPSLVPVLKKWLKRNPEKVLLFGTASNKPNTKMLRTLKRTAKRAGLNCGRCKGCLSEWQECREFTLHRFRRTYTTRLLVATGGDLRSVMEQTGHSDLESVMRYIAPANQVRNALAHAF